MATIQTEREFKRANEDHEVTQWLCDMDARDDNDRLLVVRDLCDGTLFPIYCTKDKLKRYLEDYDDKEKMMKVLTVIKLEHDKKSFLSKLIEKLGNTKKENNTKNTL